MTDSPVGALIARWRKEADELDDLLDELHRVLTAHSIPSRTIDTALVTDLIAFFARACRQTKVGAAALTAGGWHPDHEICICAAIQTKDRQIVRGHRHPDCFANMQQRTPKPELDHDAPWQGQGFITSRNRFVDRAEGMRLMAAAGAISAHTGLPLAGTKDGTPLFSEDLY